MFLEDPHAPNRSHIVQDERQAGIWVFSPALGTTIKQNALHQQFLMGPMIGPIGR